CEGEGVESDLSLAENALLVAVQEFDRVFNGNDVTGPVLIDIVDHRGKRRGLSASGRPGNQDQPALFICNFFQHRRKVKGFKARNIEGDRPKNKRDASPLVIGADTKTADSGNSVGKVHFVAVFKLLYLARVHHRASHVEDIFTRK